ncbi:MAG: hypothetical protein H7195_10365 [Chryseobacterium sp.]|nr:hypothetical protein [Chryseobacterium sp.]
MLLSKRNKKTFKMNKTLKKGLYAITSIFILLFAVFVFKIITAKPAVVNNPYVQVSRIDFKSDINPAQAKEICKNLRTIKGLTSDSIIVKRNTVVYFANNTITNSKKVYNQLMNMGSYDATRFIVPAQMANVEVCPLDRNGLTYKISKKVIQFFN